MKEYIERDALMLRIKEIHCAGCDSYNGLRCRACLVDDALDYIDSEPAADVAPVVRCKNCVYWMPKHVKVNDGTIRFNERNEGIVTIEKGINVGSYCKRFDDVTVHGYRDGEPCIDKTKAWCNQDDFCSYGERNNNGNEDRA